MDVDLVEFGDGKRIKNIKGDSSILAAEAVQQPRQEL